MQGRDLREPRSFSAAHQQNARVAPGSETEEIAQLLMLAGLDADSAVWGPLLELAAQHAYDWSERSEDSGAPLGRQAAAVLGLRTVAADILSSPVELDEVRDVAEACLSVCAEVRLSVSGPPPRRRWGEGSAPQLQERPGLLRR